MSNNPVRAKLIHYTPLIVASDAIRTCWQSFEKSDSPCDGDNQTISDERLGKNDKDLIHRVGNQYRHASTLEHLNYSFYLTISRAVLQELARHRHASLSVKSTRYTLKELKEDDEIYEDSDNVKHIEAYVAKYCVIPPIELFERVAEKKRTEKAVALIWRQEFITDIYRQLKQVRHRLKEGYPNDMAKYLLPESYQTELTWTINARALQNFLELRTSKQALWEIRALALDIYNTLPKEHRYLYEEFIQ